MNNTVDNEWIVESHYDGKRLDYWIKKEFRLFPFQIFVKYSEKA